MKKVISALLVFAIILSSLSIVSFATITSSQLLGLDKYADYILSKSVTTSVTVAVIDSGVSQIDFLTDKLVSGYDFYDDDTDATNDISDDSHGTAISSIIVGITKDLPIKIMPVRILDNKNVSIDNLINGIIYAVDNGADIINLSLGGSISDCSTIDNAINYACSNDVTVVIAAGNNRKNITNYCPAHNKDAITVSSVDEQGYFADSFSNFGELIDCCAPGSKINTFNSLGMPVQLSGTSFSAAIISAGVAMMKLDHPEYSNSKIQQILKSICKDLGLEGFDAYYGYGLPRFDWLISASVHINNNTGNKTINYGEVLLLTANTTINNDTNKICWYVDDILADVGESFVLKTKKSTVHISVKIVDANDNVVKDINGNDICDSQLVYVKSGLWQRIVSFLKDVFGVNRVVVQ